MGCYHDLHGRWRWEFRDPEGQIRDSQHSYRTFDECTEAARRMRAALGVLSSTAGEAAPAENSIRPLPQRTLLCVQPHSEAQSSIQQTLNAYAVVFASNGYEAIRSMRDKVFDAYIIDYWLPDWSGVELCRDIRKTDPRVPVCFFSSASKEQWQSRALRAGANACLRNPADLEFLGPRLRALLERADDESLHARVAEEAAIQDELERRTAAAAARVDRARLMSAEAVERMARAQAGKAFTESGGTRANFERWWPDVFAGTIARVGTPETPDV